MIYFLSIHDAEILVINGAPI